MALLKSSKILVLLVLLGITNIVLAYVEKPGPKYIATVGHPWPLPKNWSTSDTVFAINRDQFEFRIVDETCDILNDAIRRFAPLIKQKRWGRSKQHERHHLIHDSTETVTVVSVHLESPCEEKPYLGMDEAYELTIDEHPLLISKSIWGILRGLETFSQLLVHSHSNETLLYVNKTSIIDSPRFPHRGLLVDTARHYIHPRILRKILNGMSMNKLNVFHWHIVDDQSFPYESSRFPELSRRGAYHSSFTYSQREVAQLIEYARLRGIRVIVEFDSPGHTRSIGEAFPNLLTSCYGQYAGSLGPVDPTKNETYKFMRNMFEELVEVFPDKFIHLGADEVGYECWETNPEIRRYMDSKGYTKYDQLQSEYVERITEIVGNLNVTPIVWQEAFQSGLKLDKETIVQVWIGAMAPAVMRNITLAGYRALLSAGWYLDHLQFSSDFPNMYMNDPINFYGVPNQAELVLGGEACMWSEMVDDTSILPRIFPRVSAAAEKLWSHKFDMDYALRRIEEHTCRMKHRGITTQPPNGPGFCL